MYAKFLKEVYKDLIKHFETLHLKISQEDVTATAWENAEVKRFYKKGDETDCRNYRPVSLTRVICKGYGSGMRDGLPDQQ